MKANFKKVILTKQTGYVVRVEPVASAIFITENGEKWEVTTNKSGAVGC